jgi:hypothetical protein
LAGRDTPHLLARSRRVGNYLSYSLSGQLVRSERIGSNGSAQGWCALLLAAYAAGRWPESRRVQRRWLTYKRLSYLSRANVLALVQDNTENCHHAGLATTYAGHRLVPTWRRAVTLRPPRCVVLAGLVRLLEAVDADGSHDIPPDEVEPVATAVTLVLPELADSCWYEQSSRYAALLAAAEAAGGTVFIG